MGGISEMLVPQGSCSQVVWIGWAFPNLSPWLPRWADLPEDPACSLHFRHWSRMKSSGTDDLRPAVVYRGWQCWGFKNDTAVLCAAPSALLLLGPEEHLLSRQPSMCSSSLCCSLEESRALPVMWDLALFASELCSMAQWVPWTGKDGQQQCSASQLLSRFSAGPGT